MANGKGIVMHHPDTGRQITALDEKQATVYERSGWKKGTAPKATAQKEK